MITTTPMVNKSQALVERSIALSEINKRHAEIIKAARTSLDNAIRIGELLSETKSGLKHGEWLPWLQSNLTFSDRTARNYMRCYDERERLKAETISNLTEAYGLLAEHNDSPPKPPGTDADRPTLTQAEKARFAELEAVIKAHKAELVLGWVALLGLRQLSVERFQKLCDEGGITPEMIEIMEELFCER